MIERAHPSSLTAAEVLDRVLDKGIVIDALSHVSVAGTELITVRSHVVVASIDTYLKYFGRTRASRTRVPGTEAAPRARGRRPVSSIFQRFSPIRSPFRP